MPTSKHSHPVAKASEHQPASHFRPHPWHGLEARPEPPLTGDILDEQTCLLPRRQPL